MIEDRLAAAERLLGLKILECDALRAALEEIAEPADGNDHQNHCYGQRKRARQALAGQPETHHEDASA